MWKLDQLTQMTEGTEYFQVYHSWWQKYISLHNWDNHCGGQRRRGAVTRTGFLHQPGRDQRVSADNYPGEEGAKWQIDNFNELLSSWASQILQLFHTPIVWITIYIKPLVFVTACLWSVCQSLCPGAQKGAFSSSFICNERVAQHERCLAFQLIGILFWKISFSQTFVNFLSELETFAIFRILGNWKTRKQWGAKRQY